MSTPSSAHWPSKAAVVTGGARGMGGATALQLLHEGAAVHVLDALPAADPAWGALKAAAADARGLLTIHHGDVSTPSAWQDLAAALDAGGLPLAGLVNNAGITGPRNTVTQTVLVDWDHVLAVNLTGAMLGIRTLAPLMRSGGAVVNISSTVGMTGYHNAAYSASKWALRGLTRSAAMELAPRSVRVNCVCPGVVDTELIHTSPALVAALQNVIPMQAMAAPQQVAQVICFLLGPQASYVTGADFAVDGGVSGGGLYWPVGRAVGALGAPDFSNHT
jgi:NAD(P)-dependent dehydrogenase (short-subunit alcohol dehydrogenase family)